MTQRIFDVENEKDMQDLPVKEIEQAREELLNVNKS